LPSYQTFRLLITTARVLSSSLCDKKITKKISKRTRRAASFVSDFTRCWKVNSINYQYIGLGTLELLFCIKITYNHIICKKLPFLRENQKKFDVWESKKKKKKFYFWIFFFPFLAHKINLKITVAKLIKSKKNLFFQVQISFEFF
jgi:hypothetical protein